MSQNPEHVLAPLVRKLSMREELTAADHEAILALPFTRRKLEPNQYLVWDGDRPQNTCLLLSGYAYRHKLAGNGGRQILSIHMKGDILDLQNSLLGTADHNVQMLTAGEVAMIPVDSMRELAFSHPSVGMAMWYETLVEGSIFRANGCSTSAVAMPAPASPICCASSHCGSRSPTWASTPSMNCRSRRSSWPMRSR